MKYQYLDTTSPNYRAQLFEILQRKPSIIQINKLAGNAKFVPVSAVEDTLNWLFPFCWSHEIVNSYVVLNEIVMTSVLTIDVPGQFSIRRAGAASVVIQQAKDSNILDTSTKIKNALEKGFPKGKAECLKNAAKSLGPIFGSNLNRKLEMQTERGLVKIDYVSTILANDEKILKQLPAAKTRAELGDLWSQLSESSRASDAINLAFAEAADRLKHLSA